MSPCACHTFNSISCSAFLHFPAYIHTNNDGRDMLQQAEQAFHVQHVHTLTEQQAFHVQG